MKKWGGLTINDRVLMGFNEAIYGGLNMVRPHRGDTIGKNGDVCGIYDQHYEVMKWVCLKNLTIDNRLLTTKSWGI